MAFPDPLEILVLGELVLGRGGRPLPSPTPSLAATVTILAVCDRPVSTTELRSALPRRPNDAAIQQYMTRLKRDHGIPIVSIGPRGRKEYGLDPAQCRVDAQEFITGVTVGGPADDLLRLWRGAVDLDILRTKPWNAVRHARDSLIRRISGLPETGRSALTELARFAELYPDDPDVHPIRPRGRGSRPRLLVVEDDRDMMAEISDQLTDDYRVTPITSLTDWRTFRRGPGNLELIDGALVDLHLTPDLSDKRGIEIVRFLCDYTEIPAALVTANGLERSNYRHQHQMAEFRLVDIVDKKGSDWWNALAQTALLLTGTGDPERRHRLETWLETAHRKLKRETEDAPPGSVGARRRHACDEDYRNALGLVRVGDIDIADDKVTRFCRSWRTSP